METDRAARSKVATSRIERGVTMRLVDGYQTPVMLMWTYHRWVTVRAAEMIKFMKDKNGNDPSRGHSKKSENKNPTVGKTKEEKTQPGLAPLKPVLQNYKLEYS